MGDEELVHAAGYISDESEYHGDEATKSRWLSLEAHMLLGTESPGLLEDLNVIVKQARHYGAENLTPNTKPIPRGDGSDETDSVSDSDVLYRADESVVRHLKVNSRWPQESVRDFIRRVPPLDNPGFADGWIWITNPMASKNNQPRMDLSSFVGLAQPFLREYQDAKKELEATHSNAGIVTRKLGPRRESLRQRIEQLAIKEGVTNGKWMLFPHMDDVPQAWRAVCEAVVDNRLGSAAKIADGHSQGPGDQHVRLICVYTKDFSDVADVRRVCQELQGLGLIPQSAERRGIYYKTDAYTYLDMYSGNPYKLKPSLYSSADILTRKTFM